jgi:hypothetical protein
MRQVFSSPRLENVEAVAELLRAQDIEVRISNGRGYRSGIRGNFSYRDSSKAGPTPAVWVLRADQQPQARQLLRDAGLLQSGRSPDDSFLPPNLQFGSDNISVDERRQRSRLRYVLLAAVAALVGLVLVGTRPKAPDTPTTTPTSQVQGAQPPASSLIATTPAHVIATPPALAELLFARILGTQPSVVACLAIDGRDPAPALLASLARDRVLARAASDCGVSARADDRLAIDVHTWRTDGSGTGTVDVTTRQGDAGAMPLAGDTRTFRVERRGDDWRVLREP